jgi:hypothetical protein
MIVPVLLLLVFGMLDFGLAFSDKLTLGNATREGTRIGSVLVTGSTTPCTGDPSAVDVAIIASIQNILHSSGSNVDMGRIDSIQIFRAGTAGEAVGGDINVWRYTPGAGPDADPGPGTESLDFSPASIAWPACERDNDIDAPDSLGVRIDYQYRFQTPLGAVIAMLGGQQEATMAIVDDTVMALNPTN